MRASELSGKKIALWGLGREGRACHRFLERRLKGCKITVIDEGNNALLPEVLKYKPREIDLKLFDVLILSPGVSIYREEVQAALKAGVTLTTPTNIWFAEYPKARTICVTGSKGKSTTASMITHLLNQLKQRAHHAGNIGKPLLELIPDPDCIYVVELSSYQIALLEAETDLALFTNLYPEHQDWHGSREQYFKDKLRLLTMAEKVVLNGLDKHLTSVSSGISSESIFTYGSHSTIRSEGLKIYEGESELFTLKGFKPLGAHNLLNLCGALTVIKLLGLDPASCREAAESFTPLPHRLCPLGEKNGLLFVDDSISTIPEATVAALKAVDNRNLTLLAGGFDRGINWSVLTDELKKGGVKRVIAIGESGKRLFSELSGGSPEVIYAENLKAAVDKAKALTASPGTVLLSPGSPSYGEFKNFEERGLAFKKAAFDN